MKTPSLPFPPAFGTPGQVQSISLALSDLHHIPPSAGSYRGCRSLPAGITLSARAAIYRVTLQRPGLPLPDMYIGKTTNIKRRLADYLEMARRLHARYKGVDVKEDKNAYRFIHFAIARSVTEGGGVKFEYFCPKTAHDWELDRIELREIAEHVAWYAGMQRYENQFLNALPSLKRFTGDLDDEKWGSVRQSLPRRREPKNAV
jgi:hypothetical protein